MPEAVGDLVERGQPRLIVEWGCIGRRCAGPPRIPVRSRPSSTAATRAQAPRSSRPERQRPARGYRGQPVWSGPLAGACGRPACEAIGRGAHLGRGRGCATAGGVGGTAPCSSRPGAPARRRAPGSRSPVGPGGRPGPGPHLVARRGARPAAGPGVTSRAASRIAVALITTSTVGNALCEGQRGHRDHPSSSARVAHPLPAGPRAPGRSGWRRSSGAGQ